MLIGTGHDPIRYPSHYCPTLWDALCFLVFALNNRKAQCSQRRIAEKMLYLATLPGAAPDAWAAIVLLRHKNRKAAFWGVTLILTLLQGAVLYGTWPYFRAQL